MTVKNCIRKAALTVAVLLAAMLFSVPVGAEGNAYSVSFPVTVSNPDKNIPSGTKFDITIEGQPHAPLPDPARVSADANETFRFNAIGFDEPGNYTYIVKQIAPDDSHLIPDTGEYEIKVTVIRDENGDLQGGSR